MSSVYKEKDTFRRYKKEALQAAKELCYAEVVIERIQNADNAAQIVNILMYARVNGLYKNGIYK